MEARRRNEEKRLEGNTYLRKSETLPSEQEYKNVQILVFFFYYKHKRGAQNVIFFNNEYNI